MSHTIRILRNGGVHLEYSGIVTSEETKKTDSKIYQNPDHPLSKVPFIIADFSKADGVNISYEQLRNAGQADREILRNNPDLVFAIVVGKELVFGMARVWQAFLENFGDQAKVFRTIEEAEAWLKLHDKMAS